jgi:two-component system response regulator CpxR
MRAVLIVDDDIKLCTMLREYLGHHEIDLEMRHDGTSGLEAAFANKYDLILIDVMLPDMDGFELLQRLRQTSHAFVLLLTARGEAADRIRGLQLGADDYLPKPFDPEELIARIRAILRRSGSTNISSAMVSESVPARAGFTIDMISRSAAFEGKPLDLTDVEFLLLDLFIRSRGSVLTREELVSRVFNRAFHPLDRSLDMHICRLRKKLSATTPYAGRIKTIRSSGYLFSPATGLEQ